MVKFTIELLPVQPLKRVIQQRTGIFVSHSIDSWLEGQLDQLMRSINPYAQAYKMLREIMDEQPPADHYNILMSIIRTDANDQ